MVSIIAITAGFLSVGCLYYISFALCAEIEIMENGNS
jgi:hypothetical protein